MKKSSTEFDAIRRYQNENNRVRRQLREVTDAQFGMADFLEGVELAVKKCTKLKFPKVVSSRRKGTRCTAELLFSDLQIGKLSGDFSTAVAKARVKEYTKAVIGEIADKQRAGHVVERVVLALLGDIIESDKKHKNSARATDSGTATQVADAIEIIFKEVILPLALLGIPMEVVCITGNHDHDDHGLVMFRPGKEQLSWPLYQSLRMLSEATGLKHVEFLIPEGSFAVLDFYGQQALYEHGVGISVNETAMRSHKAKRSEQLNSPITYYRQGDKHTVSTFNSNQYVVNGAFFGASSKGIDYSEIAGFSSVPAQWMGWHTARNDGRFTIWDSFVIQLGHIKGGSK